MAHSDAFLTFLVFLLVVRGAIANTGTLRSLNATATQSSTFYDWSADRAIDGSASTISEQCGCCAATVQQYQPWLSINLGKLYRLGTVDVVGRTDRYDLFYGMRIYLHTQPTNWQQTNVRNVTIPYRTYSWLWTQHHTFEFNPPVIAQYVTLQLPRDKALLCLCEVKIYSNDCSAGTYGASCNETCGFCQTGGICDHLTGVCAICEPGYIGQTCNDSCPAGTFGQNCKSPCHCLDNQACDHVTGTCPDDTCDHGWRGSNCSLECEPGTYGPNCEHECGHCYSNEVCHRRTGACSVCSRGYRGIQCLQVCDRGFYGDQCLSECGHCSSNVTCNTINGRCSGGCAEGYMGDRCNIGTLSQTSESLPTVVVYASAGISVLLVCVVTGLIVVICRRRRSHQGGQRDRGTRVHGNT